jgi:hypothetical protein
MARMGKLLGLLTAAALSVSGCSRGNASLPADAFVLSGQDAKSLLSQCSRAVPAKADSLFEPDAADIARMEAGLGQAVVHRDTIPPGTDGRAVPMPGNMDMTKAPQGWARQYVGVVRGGHEFIYGNYFPASELRNMRTYSNMDPARQALVVCDGGPTFFGAEFDIESGRFTHLAFNGSP